jgi:hypothetical protein
MILRRLLPSVAVLLLATAASAKMTPEQIEARLRPIPVFVLTDGSGAPLIANGAFGAFTDLREAESFLALMRARKPELAAKVVITPIPLSEIVRLIGPDAEIQPDFVAAKSEREAAKALRGDAEPVGNAPLFVVRAGTAYLTVSRGDESLIPVFFTKKQADEVVAEYGKPNGEPARVDVTSLDAILSAMLTADDPDVAKLSLVPTDAMLADARRSGPKTK